MSAEVTRHPAIGLDVETPMGAHGPTGVSMPTAVKERPGGGAAGTITCMGEVRQCNLFEQLCQSI